MSMTEPALVEVERGQEELRRSIEESKRLAADVRALLKRAAPRRAKPA